MDGFFFWVSKLIWIIISPDSLLLLWFGLGIGLLWHGKIVWARRLLTALAVGLLLIGLFPVGEWLFYPLEKRFPANPKLQDIDGIIVLSGPEDAMRSALWDQVILHEGAERDLAFMALARRFPDAKLVFTGGTGSMLHQEFKAANAARRLFVEQGMDISRVVFEHESRNTWENAMFSKQLAQPKQGEKWVLVTTGWHMPRSVGVFCKANWPVIPYPVDFRTEPGHLLRIDWDFAGHLQTLVTGVKEWIGLLAYRLTGKSC
jgi:uncharacterized SAM-binding protein YcdF (DUF218 family)